LLEASWTSIFPTSKEDNELNHLKEGRKERRKEGKKEGRKEGRKDKGVKDKRRKEGGREKEGRREGEGRKERKFKEPVLRSSLTEDI